MERLHVKAVVKEKKESVYKPGTFYVAAIAEGWGTIKFVSTRKTLKVGDEVMLTDQWNRIQTDQIRWQEDKRK